VHCSSTTGGGNEKGRRSGLVRKNPRGTLPFAGITRIRFKGLPLVHPAPGILSRNSPSENDHDDVEKKS